MYHHAEIGDLIEEIIFYKYAISSQRYFLELDRR